MPRAINWPRQFLNEIMNEDDSSERIAIRLGSLYFDNKYFDKEDTIQIRADGNVVREAKITRDLKLSTINDLDDNLLKLNKQHLQTRHAVIEFLSRVYHKKVENDSEITLIFYKNLALQDFDIDDPHA